MTHSFLCAFPEKARGLLGGGSRDAGNPGRCRPFEDALWHPGPPPQHRSPARLLPELLRVAAIRLSINPVWIVEQSARFVCLVVRGSKVGIVPLQTSTSFFSLRKSWLRREGGRDIGGPFYLLPGIINGSAKKDDHGVMNGHQ